MRKVIAITLILLCGQSTLAQTRTGSTTGTTGTTGGTTGTGTLGNSGLSNAGFGQQFNFSQGFAATGIASPFGAATGMSGMGMSGMGMRNMGMGGMGMGGMGMMGMGMGGMGMGMGGMGMGMNRNQQNMRGGMGNSMQQQYSIRPTVKPGFDSTLPTTQVRTQQIRATMTRLPQPERFAGANITVEGKKAIVTGTVDKSQVEVLKHLLQLEPGIYEVDMSQVNGGNGSSSRNRPVAEAVTPGPAVPPPNE